MAIGRTNCFTSVLAEKAPVVLAPFSYDGGTYELTHEGKRVRLLTSGTFMPQENMSIDIFLVGGGQGGIDGASSSGRGGYGGQTKTVSNIFLEAGVSYQVTIGAGGKASGNSGGSTSFATHSVSGGYSNYAASTAFGEESETLYGEDGAGGQYNTSNAKANTGKGGDGGFGNGAAIYNGKSGGSGIVILRVHEEAA